MACGSGNCFRAHFTTRVTPHFACMEARKGSLGKGAPQPGGPLAVNRLSFRCASMHHRVQDVKDYSSLLQKRLQSTPQRDQQNTGSLPIGPTLGNSLLCCWLLCFRLPLTFRLEAQSKMLLNPEESRSVRRDPPPLPLNASPGTKPRPTPCPSACLACPDSENRTRHTKRKNGKKKNNSFFFFTFFRNSPQK